MWYEAAINFFLTLTYYCWKALHVGIGWYEAAFICRDCLIWGYSKSSQISGKSYITFFFMWKNFCTRLWKIFFVGHYDSSWYIVWMPPNNPIVKFKVAISNREFKRKTLVVFEAILESCIVREWSNYGKHLSNWEEGVITISEQSCYYVCKFCISGACWS